MSLALNLLSGRSSINIYADKKYQAYLSRHTKGQDVLKDKTNPIESFTNRSYMLF
jgi:hypothetical protein